MIYEKFNNLRLKKVQKRTALKKLYEGKNIYILPNKIRLNNSWISPAIINHDYLINHDDDFTSFMNRFEIYNCNSETGYYCKYYIEV